MAGQAVRSRLPWEDKFREPPLEALLTHYTTKQLAGVVDAARGRLLAHPGVTESLAWQGVPWRWTLVYRCEIDAARAWAYIIPDPARPQIAIPMSVPAVRALPLRRLKKAIRDGIAHARFVAGVYWPCWELTTRGALDDIIDVVQRKHRYLVSQSEALASQA